MIHSTYGQIVLEYLHHIDQIEGKNNKLSMVSELFTFLVLNKNFLYRLSTFRHSVKTKLVQLYEEEDWTEAPRFYHQLFGGNINSENRKNQ